MQPLQAPPSPAKRLTILNCLDIDFQAEMREDISKGMSLPQKSIPCKYLYDASGSMIFDEICRLPEYYPTRTELGILHQYAPAIMDFFCSKGGYLVEIGSGSDLKIRVLLQALSRQELEGVTYVPMDISETGLLQSADSLLKGYGGLRVCAVAGDFTRHLRHLPSGRKLVCFFGGTFGNFTDAEGTGLLREIVSLMGPEDRLLIGLDMLKPVKIIETAYNDRSGVTARFNLNVLSRINRELDADFRPDDFEHVAFFNHDREQVEMHLRAKRGTRALIGGVGMPVQLKRGETIHTEISRKFSRNHAESLFLRSGLLVEAWYTDRNRWFSLAELKACHR